MKFIFFTFFMLLVSFFSCFAQSVYCVDLDQPNFEQYDLFNQDLEDKKIIIIGERHYMAANTVIQAEMFIHLTSILE